MSTRNFLDKDGLLYLWGKIKSAFVVKEAGKGLSTNDYTTDEKNKLAGVESGANKTTVENVLTSNSTTNALSAAQGKVLNEKIAAINTNLEDLGAGDMLKSVYDTDGNGQVDVADNAEKLGGVAASAYAKTSAIPTKVSQLTNDSGFLTEHQDISGKVDKVDGKGLSTNDLTNALKANYDAAHTHSQAAHAPANAQANIIESVKVNGTEQSVTDKSVDITVPTKVSELANDKGYITEHQDISGKADKSTTLAGYGITNAYTKTETDSAVATAKQEAIEAVLGGVTDDFDTLKEVAAWIQADTTNSTALINRVSAIEGDYQKASELVAITNAEIDTICV